MATKDDKKPAEGADDQQIDAELIRERIAAGFRERAGRAGVFAPRTAGGEGRSRPQKRRPQKMVHRRHSDVLS